MAFQRGQFLLSSRLVRGLRTIKHHLILGIYIKPNKERRVRDLDKALDLDPNPVLALHGA